MINVKAVNVFLTVFLFELFGLTESNLFVILDRTEHRCSFFHLGYHLIEVLITAIQLESEITINPVS